MLGNGLREVSNPSEILISHKDEELSGTAIALHFKACPLMIETPQALQFTEHHNAAPRVTMPKTQYDSGRFRKELVSGLAPKMFSLNVTGGILDDPR
jgi:DNA repair protein RadA/Sms